METIRFADREHKAFFTEMLAKTRNNDVYHQAFFYAMGICAKTRRNIHSLFNFKEAGIRPEGLAAPWQTGGTRRLCRLAFNLWNGWTEEGKEQFSAPCELFDCGFAPYFFEAIRLRYPEYCRSLERTMTHFSAKAR